MAPQQITQICKIAQMNLAAMSLQQLAAFYTLLIIFSMNPKVICTSTNLRSKSKDLLRF